MTSEKYLVCNTCKSYVYVCKNGRLENRPQEMNYIAKFIEDHEYECEGTICVCDESIIPPWNDLQMPSLVHNNKWISIKDKLPSKKIKVLITDGKSMGVSKVLICEKSRQIMIQIGSGFKGDKVTHWMLLPKLPEKENG